MNKLVIGVVGAVMIFGGLLFFNKSSDKDDATPKATFSSVQQAVSSGAKLYDVRLPDEYKAGHFEGAANWSLQDMQAGKLPDVPKDTTIYVYCHSGNRSSQATTILKNAGYTNITDLHGLTNVESMGGKLITN